MTVPAVRSVADEVWAALTAVAGVNMFDAVVDIPPYDAADTSTHRFWDLDTAGDPANVHAYAAYYPSPGRAYSDRLSGRPSKMAWSCQVTCVGADRTACLWCAGKVRTALSNLRTSIGLLREVGGNESRFPTLDRDVTPPRMYVPLDFGVRVAG